MLIGIVRNRSLRDAEASFGLSIVGQVTWVSLFLVVLFERAGPTGVGLFVLFRQVAGAVSAPCLAALADRFTQRRVLACSSLLRALVAVVAIPLVVHDGPVALLYGLTAAEGALGVAPIAIQNAFLPRLAVSEPQLAGANAVSSMLQAVAVLVGGVLDALLLWQATQRAVLLTTAGIFVAASLLVTRVRPPPATGEDGHWSFARRSASGLRYLRRDRRARRLVTALALAALFVGVAQEVSSSVAIGLLHLGHGGTPLCIALFGAGALVGGLLGLSLASGHRASTLGTAGVALMGLGPLVLAAAPWLATTVAVLVVCGVGMACSAVSCRTLLQRAVDRVDLGPTTGASALVDVLFVGAGAVLTGLLDGHFGLRWTLVVVGTGFLALTGPVLSWLRAAE